MITFHMTLCPSSSNKVSCRALTSLLPQSRMVKLNVCCSSALERYADSCVLLVYGFLVLPTSLITLVSYKVILGDILVIAGTIFFAMSNVGEEFCVKKKDRVEVICMIGVYGFLVSACQMSILELKTLESVEWSTDIILAFAGYGVSGLLFYTLAPLVLKLSGATLLNLSILTSDMWAVVFRIFFYRQQVDWLYYLAFAVVVIGLIIYSLTEKDPVPVPALENGNPSLEYQVLEDESATTPRNQALTS